MKPAQLFPVLLVMLLATGCGKPTDSSETLVVHIGSGNWAAANMKAYVEPFERETGIRVTPVADDLKVAQLKLMDDADSVEIDVIDMPAIEAGRSAALGLLSPIDYSLFKEKELAGLRDETRRPWGVGALYYSIVLSSRGAGPQTWSDLWDTQRFPGARTLFTGEYGDGPWEEALLADGVPADRLYPLDIERAFRSLDRIRPSVKRWWRAGSEGQQLFRDDQVTLGEAYDGRIADLAARRPEIQFTYNQGKLLLDYWVIPRKARHRAAAQKFVELATRADRQAQFAQLIAYGPTNLGAYDLIPAERAARLPSHPDNLAKQFRLDAEWYLRKNEHGESNHETLIRRWQEWILK